MEKQESLLAASLDTPAMPVPAAVNSFRRPDWILLDKVACLADRPNGTTARCISPSSGQAVEVSFWLADPPGLSQLCVHCPGLEETDFVFEPTVVCSEKNIAVLQIFFSFGPKLHAGDPGHREYFVYEADPDHPSLRPLPTPYLIARLPYEFGLLLSIDGGFRIAVLRPQKLLSNDGAYDLHIFSSKTWAWSTKTARLGPQPSPRTKSWCLMHQTDKVIILQEDTLGFVDLWHGILCCRVIDDSPDLLLRFIPLPPPMENNNSSSGMRDVTCIHGVIKFLEIAHRKRLVVRERSHAPSPSSHRRCVLYDSDLLELANSAGSTTGTKDVCHYAYDGWNAVTWNRLTGSDHWLLDCEIDVDDVTVSNPKHIALLPGLTSTSHSATSTTLNRNIRTSAPAFGMHNGDVVYLTCKVDKTGWVLEINTRMRRLENLAPFSAERTHYFSQAYYHCALSKHMNMDMPPRKRKERDDAKNVPTDPTLLVHGVDPCLTEDQLRKIFTMFGELRGLNIHANQHYASVQLVRRVCAEKAMRIMNGSQFGRKKLAISWEIDGQNIHLAQPTIGQSLEMQTTTTGRFQSHGYYLPQLKPPPVPRPYYSYSSSHQEVAENKKPRLNVGT